jgi:TatD DNase family protein
MIDVHCHLNFHSFKNDTDGVINSALKAGVTKIINVGTKIDSSKHAVELSEKYDELYAIVGVHPHHADKLALKADAAVSMHEENWITALDRLASHPKVLAIGEIGMDYYRYKSNGVVDPKLQREVFIEQIKLAHKHQLPLQIHNRQAGEEVVAILREYKALLQPIPGMFHCFAATHAVLDEILTMGFYIGFDGNITYPGLAPGESVDLRDLCKAVPLDRLVVETDSPYLTPIPHRGQRNVPAYVIITAEYIANLRDIPYKKLVEQTTQNVYTIFNRLAR